MSSAATDRVLAASGLSLPRGDRELLSLALTHELTRERHEATARETNRVAALVARKAEFASTLAERPVRLALLSLEREVRGDA